MAGSLPPSSTPQGINRSPARAAMARPVLVSRELDHVHGVHYGCARCAQTGDTPEHRRCTDLLPAGDEFAGDSEVTSEGLTRTAAPASSAATASTPGMSNGKFQGVITPTTGYGRYTLVSFLVAVSGPCGLNFFSARNFCARSA